MSDLVKDHHGLTARQKAFADAWAHAKMQGANFADWQIAQAAGYSGDKDALAVNASRTLAHPKVRDYLHQRAKDYLREGAVEVAVTLRTLSQKAGSERVRADTAARLAAGLGLIDQEHGERGPGVAIQIVFRTDAGALLAQPPREVPNVQVDQRPARVEHALAEGEGGRKARRATPPPGQARAGGAAPGVKTAARSPAAGSPARRSPRKLSGKISGGGDG